jgi:pimeloyl-ACP methyl ester carboxylesterase
MPDTGGSNPFVALARHRGAYTSEDMTDDAIAVLDALGWKQAHIFGASLGGIIAQRIALRHPDRVLSVISMAGLPSDVSGLGAGRYVRLGMLAKLARAKVPEGREGDLQLSLMLARAVASPAYPFDEQAAREWIEREADSGPRDTKAQSRQAGAAWHGPKLRELRKPVLVLHGDQDPLLRVSAARATARAIAGARLVILPGVGHDLPAPLWPAIADEVRLLADRAQAAEADSARPAKGRSVARPRPYASPAVKQCG